ncbi:cell envelope biogenesis protein LolA [Rhodospirillum rubrum]|uniref:LolA family protein n=1 Tax=Rhodospirillum rubrum TaxID=1085 RepID=UPI001906410A|nr:outer-membrane lipoprotein carrier protein LolA [Rhodospirillum rubrum]MBK1663505.1 cell envelope biogenesis protein LolA [Rhodospirillum rubrum]MBK1675703.1 cell envelope biogenesis protein LolA [Rhodospirillum rubrum]
MAPKSLFAALALFVALAVGLPAGPASAQEARSILPQLTQDQRAFVARVEGYLNGVRRVQARFLQVSSTGNYAEGTVSISRPNRMRLQYDLPTDLLMVANGSQLVYYDRELDQVSYIGLDSTPLAVLLRDKIELSDPNITVTAYREAKGVVEIALVQTNDPGQGTLTLVFTTDPVELRQWRVLDAQNVEVSVSLFNPQVGITLDPKLFVFSESAERPKRDSR